MNRIIRMLRRQSKHRHRGR